MKFSFSAKFLTVLLLQTAFDAQVMAQYAFVQPFGDMVSPAPPAWTVANGSASVVAGQTGATGNSLELAKGTGGDGTETTVVQPVTWDPAQQIAFIDLKVKPAANTAGSLASIFANGAQIAFQDGKIWVYHGTDDQPAGTSPQWTETVGSYTIAPGTTEATTFLHLTLREDYTHHVWDLYVDGQLVAANLGFEGRETNLTDIEFYGSLAGKVHVDELGADPANMLFTDADKDGLPDSWESTHGGNPAVYDRDTIVGGKSLLQSYMESLWSAGSRLPNGKVAGSMSDGGGNSIPPLNILALHQPVGAVKGSLSAGGDGSAVYSIPIDVPKGTAGMEPKLSLNYSSSGGNGFCGVGWTLGGLQKVTRGVGSAVKDGNYHSIDFSQYDRFFLDGERLVCVAGTYGADQSEYRTEMDGYARITLNGTGSAQWWKVETKAGLIVELGHTSDSIEAATGGLMSWSVNKISDTVGNYYTVGYARDTVSGIDVANLRVDNIAYTGNTAAGLAPYCQVFFDYEARTDVSRAYGPQLSHIVSKRLSKIRVVTDGTYVNHSYVLGYTTSYQSSRSFLTSIKKLARDNPSLAIPASTFTYDGLATGASPWGAAAQNSQWPVYNATWDATGSVNSMVSLGDGGTSIRLDGDVARVTPLPGGPVNVFSDSIMTFKVHAENFVSGAYIALDNDMTYTASPSRLTLIKGSGTPSGGIVRRDIINYAPGTDGWMTVSVPVGQVATGLHGYLALINVDDNPNDGISNIVFKDVRIYRTSDTSVPAPLVFSGQWEVPHFSDNLGRDLGIRFMDLNSDGLPEMCDWRAAGYDLTAGVLTPETEGQIYRNTGNGFVLDNSLKPPAALPISSRKQDLESYNYDKKHHLFAREMDINGDGRPDFLASTNIKQVSGSLSNDLTFWTNSASGWQEMTAYKMPFRVKNIGSSAPYGGTPRDQHYEWVDIDSDGYTDLVMYTTTQGMLVDPANESTVIVPGDTTTCWLNKVHLGLGWVRSDSLGLPEMLQRTYPTETSIGRKLLDITGDGHPEIMESLSGGTTEQRNTYQMTLAANGKVTGWTTTKDADTAPTSKFDLPKVSGSVNNAPFVNLSGDPLGGEMLDLNGDGLPDYVRKVVLNGVTSGCVYMNLGKGTSTVWGMEPAAGTGSPAVAQTASYDVPRPLYFNLSASDYRTGYEFTDINGDGLPDLLVSQNTGTDNGTNIHNVVLLNTGNGWDSRVSWGLPGDNRIYNTYADSQNGKRRSMLQDLNGDGFPDLITGLVDQAPQVWINQCKPEVLLSVTDGMGSTLGVEYRHLNDPTPLDGDAAGRPVYTANTGTLPIGQIAVEDSRMVVSRLKEPDGQGGWRCLRHHYGDLRFDHFNDASLGFGWTEVHTELWPVSGSRVEKSYSLTQVSRSYPNAGSPIYVASYTNMLTDGVSSAAYLPGVTAGFKLTAETTSAYGELPYFEGVGGWVRRPVQLSSVEKKYDFSGLLLAQVTTSQTYENIILPAISWAWNSTSNKMAPTGTTLSTWNNLNVYGFANHNVVTSLDGTVVDTASTFQHTTTGGKWFLGRLLNTVVVKTPASGSGSTVSKQSVFTYSAATGLLTSETVQSGSLATVTNTNSYDSFGNVTGISVTDGTQTRSKSSTYDSRGRLPDNQVDALGNTTSFSYDKQAGLLLSSTVNGLTSSFDYDDFGTRLVARKPDGMATAEITRYASNSDLPAQVAAALNQSGDPGGVTTIKWQRSAQTSGSPWSTVYFDAQGRESVTEKTVITEMSAAGNPSFGSQYTIVKYDNRGRKLRVSDPFLLGNNIYWTSLTYDPVDRLMETTHPDGTVDGVKYLEAVTLGSQPCMHSVIHSRKGALVERWDDQHGRLVRSTDPSGQLTLFTNDVDGNVLQVSVAGQIVLTNTYDAFGHKTDVVDADAGASHTQYNGFGEATSVRNARNQTSTTTYDVLGRVVTMVDAEGTWTHYYVTSGPAYAEIDHITGPGSYLEQYTYDSLGRPTQFARTQFGETLVTSTTYNALGELKTATNAGGVTTTSVYDPVYGCFKVREDLTSAATGPIGIALWKFGSIAQSGDQFISTETLPGPVQRVTITNAKTGRAASILSTRNGDPTKVIQNLSYTWDDNGNLITRTDNVISKTETFEYDGDGKGLDRLTKSTVTGQSAVSYSYDAKGNLLTKGADTLSYGGTRPHAVSTATIKGGSRSYTYDADGNVTADSKRTYGWTSFGQLGSVTQTSCPLLKSFDATTSYTSQLINGIPAAVQFAASSATAVFDFDGTGARSRQTITRTFSDGSTADIYHTYAGTYEREVSGTTPAGGFRSIRKTIHRHMLAAGSTYTVDDTVGAPTGPVARLSTVLTDPLGSTDVILVSEFSAGAWNVSKAERQSFNAWGERRSASDWTSLRTVSTDNYQGSGADYRRGYTGHEMLDDFGLVHMNGRIYDAELGRFLSPDPYVQVPEWSQNFNRYSYVLNNPLSHTDPTGHKIGGIAGLIVMAVIAVAAFYVAAAVMSISALGLTTGGSLTIAGDAAVGAFAGAMTGAANCAVQGGSGSEIAKSALTSGVVGAISGGILGPLEHGGGWTQDLIAKGSITSKVLFVAGHGIVGGASNAVMGQKFQDGFLSAAFSSFFTPPDANLNADAGGMVVGMVASGILGGTGSALGGGKFGNGAFTGAFQALFSSLPTKNGEKSSEVADDGMDASGRSYKSKPGEGLDMVGVTKSEWKNGFAAALYMIHGRYFLAFRGTEPFTGADWFEDFAQALGFKTSQYEQAIELGKAVQAAVAKNAPGTELIFVGHSLGGGLASAAALATGVRAETYNAAGLSNITNRYRNGGYTPQIDAYYIKGDILSTIQDYSPFGKAVGVRHPGPARAIWEEAIIRHIMWNFPGSKP